MKCEYIYKNRETDIFCNHLKKYGNYCFKHRSNYLLCENKSINFKRFTYESKDYTVNDIKRTLSNLYPSKKYNKYKKNELFNILIQEYKKLNNIDSYTQKIILCQSYIRKYLVQNNIIRGPGFFNRELCKNDEDFLYMTSKTDTNNIYFFSYKDNNNATWFFDIRSFNKLLQHNQLNPYTREEIPVKIIENANILTHKLIDKNINISIEEVNQISRKEMIKQKTVDLFSTITQNGHFCDINWLLTMNILRLKTLYKKLEDIWNYRAFLSEEVKSRIAPPNGLVFNISINDVYDMTDRYEIIDLILNEVNKFNNAVSIEDRKLGYMYFLIGLSECNLDCLNAHDWIQHVLN